MIKNSSKLLFLFTLMSGSLIAISSNSWLGSWMGLEINLLSFIPLMINTNNLMSTEASLKYFLTQALASSMLLFSIIMFMMMTNMVSHMNIDMNYCSMMINSTLMLKMGAAPFHFWFPGVMEGLTWMNNLILMTWQKIAPLMLISYCLNFNLLMYVIILSVMVGSLGGLNQTSLRKIMAFSSINHLGWMLAAMLVSENLWMFYFMFYSFLSFTLVFMFNAFKLFHISQTFSMFSNYPVIKFCLFMSLLSLGGLPPFLGFLPKWMVIQSMVEHNFIFLMIIMVCLTLITLYFYIRICYSAFMLNYWETSWNFNMSYNKLNMQTSLILSFLSLTGLILMSSMYWIF
uniref:NADH-ubiquinone oxidoreductase chain 2 n=1 Tax=Pedicia sp. ZK-2016 TaxID=1808012 RepID=A0A191F7Q1_9DIPT|nr:NADH dehydrogenase subunit 2 [Pedicia sp. ZK-2016]